MGRRKVICPICGGVLPMHAENCPRKLQEDYTTFIEGANLLFNSDPFKEWEELEKEFMPSETTSVQIPRDPLKGVKINVELDNTINDIIDSFAEALEKSTIEGYYYARISHQCAEEFTGLYIFEPLTPHELIMKLNRAYSLLRYAIRLSNSVEDYTIIEPKFEVFVARSIPIAIQSNAFVYFTRNVVQFLNFRKPLRVEEINRVYEALTEHIRNCKGCVNEMLVIDIPNKKIKTAPRIEIEEFVNELQEDAKKYTGYD